MGNSAEAPTGRWWQFLPRWVLATAWPSGLFIILPPERSPWGSEIFATEVVVFLILIAVTQWWALHGRISGARAWAAMTLIGAVLGILAQFFSSLFFLTTVEQVTDTGFLPLVRSWEASEDPAEILRYGSSGGAFGLVLGAMQSLVAPFAWSSRLIWTALSAVASALSFAATFVAFDFNLSYGSPLWVTATSIYLPVPPIAWISYTAINGIVLHRLLVAHNRREAEGVLRRFE